MSSKKFDVIGLSHILLQTTTLIYPCPLWCYNNVNASKFRILTTCLFEFFFSRLSFKIVVAQLCQTPPRFFLLLHFQYWLNFLKKIVAPIPLNLPKRINRFQTAQFTIPVDKMFSFTFISLPYPHSNVRSRKIPIMSFTYVRRRRSVRGNR